MSEFYENVVVLACIPKCDFPDSPPEAIQGARIEKCEECYEEVWLAPKKSKMYDDWLKMMKNKYDMRIICFPCLQDLETDH